MAAMQEAPVSIFIIYWRRDENLVLQITPSNWASLMNEEKSDAIDHGSFTILYYLSDFYISYPEV